MKKQIIFISVIGVLVVLVLALLLIQGTSSEAERSYSGETAATSAVAEATVDVGVDVAAVEPGPTEELHIVTGDGVRHLFHVEIAETPRALQQGLMFRQNLPEDHGMLFVFETEGVRNFWMKNTYVPLDMLFINADGTIQRIARNAVPLSQAIVSSEVPVLHVLELLGGTASRLGLQEGDVVHHRILGNELAE